MFSMIMDSMRLFITGRLFTNYGQVIMRGFIAAAIGAAVIVGAGHVLPSILAFIIGGAVSGFLLPIFYKNLKYR